MSPVLWTLLILEYFSMHHIFGWNAWMYVYDLLNVSKTSKNIDERKPCCGLWSTADATVTVWANEWVSAAWREGNRFCFTGCCCFYFVVPHESLCLLKPECCCKSTRLYIQTISSWPSSRFTFSWKYHSSISTTSRLVLCHKRFSDAQFAEAKSGAYVC